MSILSLFASVKPVNLSIGIPEGVLICSPEGSLITSTSPTKAWKNVPYGLDLLVTHTPPSYILDLTNKGYHIGDDVLLRKVNEVKPRYHLFGHVHEAYGSMLYGITNFHNCAMMNRDYVIANAPLELEI